jgi:Ca-activated chloride channel family protein
MRIVLALLAITWAGLWFTPDQQGRRFFERGKFAEAAKTFHDPLWQGVAWYRAGDFKQAAAAFSRRETPEAYFNKGDALLMTGSYDAAIEAYTQALDKRPGWKEAKENRDLANARKKLTADQGGDLGDQRVGADKVVFDQTKENPQGQETEVAGDKAMSTEAMQSLWLRKVTTKPADFLRSKFAYQYQTEGEK